MNKIKFDLFKTSLIVLLAGFLFVFYLNSQNGRYVNCNNENWRLIINTRTGEVYAITEKGLIQVSKKIKQKNLNIEN